MTAVQRFHGAAEAPPPRPVRPAHGGSAVEGTGRGVGEALDALAACRATGALHGTGTTVHLVDGGVVHVDSGRTLGLVPLLTVSGRLPRTALRVLSGEPGTAPSFRLLLGAGLLTQGELELCHLGALFDAGFFALDGSCEAVCFEPGAEHWLGRVNQVPVRVLRREARRRRALLERTWPWPQVDTAPVVHGNRRGPPPGRRQRELLALADGSRSPADLARILGRSTFATLLDVRRLAAAGFVATPAAEPAGPGEPRGGTAGLPRRTPERSGHRSGPPPAAGRPDAGSTDAGSPGPRRSAAGRMPTTDPDTALLARVLIALEARL